MLERVTFAFVLLAIMGTSSSFADKRNTPEVVREFSSPSGEFQLVVTGCKGWLNPRPSAQLFRVAKSGQPRSEVWKIDELPHRLGPWDVLISNEGVVVLVDEWVRTPTPLSLMVIDPVGKIKVVHSIGDIAKFTGNSPTLLIDSAKMGIWQSSKPMVSSDSQSITFFTGDTNFSLSLESGEMSRQDSK